MMQSTLQIPAGLQSLIDNSHWPTRPEHVKGQDLQSYVPQHLVDNVFPGERNFCFSLPPFKCVMDLKRLGSSEYEWFWSHEDARPDQLIHEKILVIADFMIGSDSAVILNYELDPIDPPVMWLRWEKQGTPNQWVKACDNIGEMAERLQLHQLHFTS